MKRMLLLAGCLSLGVIWLAVLLVSGFNLVAVSSGLLGAVYLMGRS